MALPARWEPLRLTHILIHRSAWRNCLENRNGSRIGATKVAKRGRRSPDRLPLAAKEVRSRRLQLFSKQFRKGSSPNFAGTRNGATPHKKRAGRLVPALDVSF